MDGDGDEAMSAYARGETAAFASVYDAVAPRLARYLGTRVRDAALVEDLVQQTFLQMHAARGAFIVGSPVLPWAISIAHHLLCDVQRKRKRERPGPTGDEQAVPAWRLRDPDGEAWVHAGELQSRLEAAYEQLTPPQREALDLRVQGHSVAEAARTLQTSSMGVKLRVRRALLSLRAAVFSERAPEPASSARSASRERRSQP